MSRALDMNAPLTRMRADPVEMRAAIRGFMDWMQTYDDVYFVTNQQVRDGAPSSPFLPRAQRHSCLQLLAWMQNPIPISQMRSSSIVACSTPDVPADLKICNGIEQNEVGLLEQCPFTDFPW